MIRFVKFCWIAPFDLSIISLTYPFFKDERSLVWAFICSKATSIIKCKFEPFSEFVFPLRTTELASAGRVSDDESDDDDDVSDVEDRQGTYEEDFQIDPKDETAFNAFMNTDSAPRKTLADLVIIFKLPFF